MINYKKVVSLIILFSIGILNTNGFCKKRAGSIFVKIDKRTNNDCNLIIVDTIIKSQSFKVCYDSLKNKIEINFKGKNVDFTPLESFDPIKTINDEVVLLAKDKTKYYQSKFIIIDDNKVLVSLIDDFLSFGLYIISEINGKLVVNAINLNNNVSYTELAYFDITNKNIIVSDILSLNGKKSMITVYDLSKNKPEIIKQKIIDWSKFKGQIKKSKDEYVNYNIIHKLVN